MVSWFYGKETGLVSSGDVIAYLGAGLSDSIQRKLYAYYGSIMPSLYISFGAMAVSIIACCTMLSIDKWAKIRDKKLGFKQ